jgi:hypothetical protein
LGGMCAAVASGHESQRQEQSKSEETREPHITIILSE